MILQPDWPPKPPDLRPQLERTQLFVLNTCPCPHQEKILNSPSIIGHDECAKVSTTKELHF